MQNRIIPNMDTFYAFRCIMPLRISLSNMPVDKLHNNSSWFLHFVRLPLFITAATWALMICISVSSKKSGRSSFWLINLARTMDMSSHFSFFFSWIPLKSKLHLIERFVRSSNPIRILWLEPVVDQCLDFLSFSLLFLKFQLLVLLWWIFVFESSD